MKQLLRRRVTMVLAFLLILSLLLSARWGAVSIAPAEMGASLRHWFTGASLQNLNERIFLNIRLPRALLCCITGAGLAVGGVLMQALFRNPIVEPGLMGTSSGAAFGAALYFVLGAGFKLNVGEWTLPVAACAGSLLSTILVLQLSTSRSSGRTSAISLLLTGIAVNAIFMSGVGFLSYIARDPQARSITFWGLGTLSGANWHSVIITSIVSSFCWFWAWRVAGPLNALALGETEAGHLGISAPKLRNQVLVINVLMIAVSTAFTGIISFVGLVIPHLLRMTSGADNKKLVVNAALLGGAFLNIADLFSRMLLRPAELPIGIVTAMVGAPVFILLLRRKHYFF